MLLGQRQTWIARAVTFTSLAGCCVMALFPLPGAVAAPMKPVVLADACPWVHQSVSGEQAHMEAASHRYSVEVARDEDLPLLFRKSETPKGAPLLNIGF